MSKIVDYSINPPEVVVEAKRGVKPSSVNAYNQASKGLASLNIPTDTYRESFAQAVTPSNEIDYTRSNADRIIKDYQDSELADVDNSIEPQEVKTPVVNEDVPIVDTTVEYEPPTEEMKKFEEEKTQAQWQKDYLDSIWSKEDEEAAEKKQKAAQWITAAQMLGDSLTALGNSYFVAKGANNMGASQGSAKAAEATSKLHEDIRNARERAAKAKYELEKARKEWEYRKEKDKKAQDNADRTHNENVRHNTFMEGISQQNADTAAINARTSAARLAEETGKKNEPVQIMLEEGWVEIPKKKWTSAEISSVYNQIPEDVRKVIETITTETGADFNKKTSTRQIKPTPEQMEQYIGQYKHLPEVANALRKLAGLKPVEPKKEEVKSEVLVNPLTGESYSVNPDNPLVGGVPHKKTEKVEIIQSTGEEDPYK